MKHNCPCKGMQGKSSITMVARFLFDSASFGKTPDDIFNLHLKDIFNFSTVFTLPRDKTVGCRVLRCKFPS